MRKHGVYWWKKIPMARLLPGLISGILANWYLHAAINTALLCCFTSFLLMIIYQLLDIKYRFRFRSISGISVFLLTASLGCWLTWSKNPLNKADHFSHSLDTNQHFLATLQEPLVEKPNSFKSTATVRIISDSSAKSTSGRIIIYFSRKIPAQPGYGSMILFKKDLQTISSSGNPGSFSYARYCFFQGITHQVYLEPGDFVVIQQKENQIFRTFIFNCRRWITGKLKKYIPGPKEQGLAQALLIGYKDDLDKNLVQSYSNTGVVHVIAISGLHLGLIYTILLSLTRPLKKIRIARLVIIVLALWIFSILAGAQPSVLRSAVMFSCIALGEVISRKGSVFNTLALSAFILLCYDPFWLWDAGFQLSYAAVLSILLFYRDVYNWFYFKNKLADHVWKLNAVTISAQLLTLPVSIYHFHQVPTLFLFSNLVAVPLSSLILIGEIILCSIFFIEPLADWLGKLLHYLIYIMNSFIEWFDSIPFAVWKGLSIDSAQALSLTVFIILLSQWLRNTRKLMLGLSLFSVIIFLAIRSRYEVLADSQRLLVVYNIPRQPNMDIIWGRQSWLHCDSSLRSGHSLWNFHIEPSRIFYRIHKTHSTSLPSNFELSGKKIMRINGTGQHKVAPLSGEADLLVISGNPGLYISVLSKSLRVKNIVADASVPAWKARLWKKDCDSLSIPFHWVAENGAFVMPL